MRKLPAPGPYESLYRMKPTCGHNSTPFLKGRGRVELCGKITVQSPLLCSCKKSIRTIRRTCKLSRVAGVSEVGACWRNPELVDLLKFCGSRTCKPNSVRRIAPAGRPFLWAEHYCAAQATYPEVVAHRAGTRLGRTRDSLPIWSCSVWGLPCPLHYCGGSECNGLP